MGLEGILINFKGNHRIVVSVTLLRRSVALEIDRILCEDLSATGRESSLQASGSSVAAGRLGNTGLQWETAI